MVKRTGTAVVFCGLLSVAWSAAGGPFDKITKGAKDVGHTISNGVEEGAHAVVGAKNDVVKGAEIGAHTVVGAKNDAVKGAENGAHAVEGEFQLAASELEAVYGHLLDWLMGPFKLREGGGGDVSMDVSKLIRKVELTDEGAEVGVDLDALRSELKREVPGVVWQRAPAILHDGFTWPARFRFSNLALVVDDVRFHRTERPNRIGVEIIGGIDADRQEMQVSVDKILPHAGWHEDGRKRIMDLHARGVVVLEVRSKDKLSVGFLADAVDWKFLLKPLEKEGRADLGGRALHGAEMKVPDLTPLGARYGAVRITEVRDQEAVVVLEMLELEDEGQTHSPQ